jgi:hypothetical protein
VSTAVAAILRRDRQSTTNIKNESIEQKHAKDKWIQNQQQRVEWMNADGDAMSSNVDRSAGIYLEWTDNQQRIETRYNKSG